MLTRHSSEISTTNAASTAPVYHEIEKRVFKGLRKKLDDKLQAIKDRKKKNPNDKDATTGGVGAADDVPLMPVPERYNGPPPLGMNQEPELSTWVRI